MLGVTETCPHEVEAVPGNEDWGHCRLCGADDFPMTDAAAYGPVDCATCHGMGLVPVPMTDCDGAPMFADARCPACGPEFSALGAP